ncbi:hypothetical protein VMCG_05605 [Cytospora schulzeri]|uniref:Isochorismatase-like domain-containing protein n=1 Tax=Cytospora schulzeri TaxID=448051 RepID=A0A423WFI6_9PEZI|nr:hypothetical protein VMCG_05605 [Valsa malicola]
MAPNKVEVIGGPGNFWLYLKTALVVIDLQNYFLSPALGRPRDAVGTRVVNKLVDDVIPACRRAGIPIVWLNWGLTDHDIETMPQTIVKGFAADTNFVAGEKRIGPLGTDIGPLTLEDGLFIEGGRILMKGEWNAALYHPLVEKADAGQDIWIYKNRLSGFWGGTTVEEALHARGIRILLFSGANTDQCVGGSIQDAFTRGWDCLMLSDACATTSPDYATKMIEYNAAGGWGFLLSTEQFAEGCQQFSNNNNRVNEEACVTTWKGEHVDKLTKHSAKTFMRRICAMTLYTKGHGVVKAMALTNEQVLSLTNNVDYAAVEAMFGRIPLPAEEELELR